MTKKELEKMIEDVYEEFERRHKLYRGATRHTDLMDRLNNIEILINESYSKQEINNDDRDYLLDILG